MIRKFLKIKKRNNSFFQNRNKNSHLLNNLSWLLTLALAQQIPILLHKQPLKLVNNQAQWMIKITVNLIGNLF